MSKSTTTTNELTASKIVAALFNANLTVYKASSKGSPKVVYKNAASIIPHRGGVRFALSGGGSGWVVLTGIHAGKVCFKATIPALSKLSTSAPTGFSILKNAYISTNTAEAKTLINNVIKVAKGSVTKPKKSAVKPASTPTTTSAV